MYTPNCHLGKYIAITKAELLKEMRYSYEKYGRAAFPVQ